MIDEQQRLTESFIQAIIDSSNYDVQKIITEQEYQHLSDNAELIIGEYLDTYGSDPTCDESNIRLNLSLIIASHISQYRNDNYTDEFNDYEIEMISNIVYETIKYWRQM